MGVANHRSIAWSCVESFLRRGDWDVILTYQNDRFASKVDQLIQKHKQEQQQESSLSSSSSSSSTMVVARQVNIQTDLPQFFQQQIPDLLQERKIHAIVHSIAHASNLSTPLLHTTVDDYLEAHAISAYSLLDVARASHDWLQDGSSITALTYLGAIRAISGYHVMGPAKASLEAIVRGLALELGASVQTRVNAVSSGPLATLSAKGGISNLDQMRAEMSSRAPLGNVTARQVAETVYFLATEGTGITGQTIYVDGGYSIVGGPPPSSEAR